jgi:hypothetical protein
MAESPTLAGDTIVTGAAVLLGHAGIAVCEADAKRMQKSLVVVLVERDDPVVSWLITTVEIVLH